MKNERVSQLCTKGCESRTRGPFLPFPSSQEELFSYSALNVFVLFPAQASQDQNSTMHTWCMGQLVYIENFMGKSPIEKSCVNDYKYKLK